MTSTLMTRQPASFYRYRGCRPLAGDRSSRVPMPARILPKC